MFHLVLKTHILALMTLVGIADIGLELLDSGLHGTPMYINSLLHLTEARLEPLLSLLLPLTSLQLLRVEGDVEFVELVFNGLTGLLELSEHEFLLLLHLLLDRDEILTNLANCVLHFVSATLGGEL